MNVSEQIRIVELTQKSLNEEISPEEFSELNAMLKSSDEACRFFHESMNIYLSLDAYGKRVLTTRQSAEEVLDETVWQALAEDEKQAPTVKIEKPVEKRQPVKMLKVEKQPREFNKLSIYTAIVSTAAMLLVLLMVASSPVRPPVATLTDAIDAQWQDKKNAPVDGDILRQGTLMLTRGLAEITFDHGARVVVEGPAEVDLQTAGKMALLWGRAYATVPEHATGFIMQTPNSMVVDLGTEFGVIVDHGGETEVHMVKGQSSLVPGQEGKAQKGQLLTAGQARRIDASQRVHTIQVATDTLVRHFASESGLVLRGTDTLSLADMVGGGNGTGTGLQGHGINLRSGGQVLVNQRSSFAHGTPYAAVKTNPYVDSVFIPDGGRGDVLISSTGMVFQDFRNTVGRTTDHIYHQGESIFYAMGLGARSTPAMMDGKRYGPQGAPAIFMHANAGITFDLAAIRSLLGDSMTISGLRVLCGVPDGMEEGQLLGFANPDFWVLVDGQERFKRLNMKSDATAEKVEISLTGQERFLTLAVTDGGNNYDMDLALFGDPVLVLNATDE